MKKRRVVATRTGAVSGGPGSLGLSMILLLTGCGGGDERDLGDPVGDNPCDIPVDNRHSLYDWLEVGSYELWPSEGTIHESAGPHMGNVRTWVSPELETSLNEDSPSHPLCSVAVKELYGDDERRDGWAVLVKVADTKSPSDWYWYEIFEEELFAAGTTVDTCVNCHNSGTDMVLTTTPL
jgi:hypothetical protein